MPDSALLVGQVERRWAEERVRRENGRILWDEMQEQLLIVVGLVIRDPVVARTPSEAATYPDYVSALHRL